MKTKKKSTEPEVCAICQRPADPSNRIFDAFLWLHYGYCCRGRVYAEVRDHSRSKKGRLRGRHEMLARLSRYAG